MSSVNNILDVSESSADLNPINEVLVQEILKHESLEEQIVRKINESKRTLRQEVDAVLQQSQKIQQIEESIASTSKKLEQKAYENWNFGQNLTNVRALCQVVNSYTEKADDLLNRSQVDGEVYDRYLLELQEVLNNYVSKTDGELEEQENNVIKLRKSIEEEEELYGEEIKLLTETKAQCVQKLNTERQRLQQHLNELENVTRQKLEFDSQVAAISGRIIKLREQVAQKEAERQSVFAAIEEEERQQSVEIEQIKLLIENERREIHAVVAKNEAVVQALAEQNNANDKLLAETQSCTDQLDDYRQKCLIIEAEEKQIEERFTSDHRKAANEVQRLTNEVATAKQKYIDEVAITSQMKMNLAAVSERKQLQRATNANLTSEILKLRSSNSSIDEELAEKQASIASLTANIIRTNNDLLDLKKKLISSEARKFQAVTEITKEIHQLENQLENLERNEISELSKMRAEGAAYETSAQNDFLKSMNDNAQELASQNRRLEEIKRECGEVANKIKEEKNDLEHVALECEYFTSSIQKALRAIEGKKKGKALEASPGQGKRKVDETSDISMDGAVSNRDHVRKLRAKK